MIKPVRKVQTFAKVFAAWAMLVGALWLASKWVETVNPSNDDVRSFLFLSGFVTFMFLVFGGMVYSDTVKKVGPNECILDHDNRIVVNFTKPSTFWLSELRVFLAAEDCSLVSYAYRNLDFSFLVSKVQGHAGVYIQGNFNALGSIESLTKWFTTGYAAEEGALRAVFYNLLEPALVREELVHFTDSRRQRAEFGYWLTTKLNPVLEAYGMSLENSTFEIRHS